MNNLIKATIKKYSLIEKGDRVLVGLSGGADSMCLAHALVSLAEELGITVGAAHLNHNIREEAEADALASEEFARRLCIDFYLRSENVIEYANKNNISEELAGRELRYKFFAELCKKYGYTKIATAHNKNDNAETLMMNFMRGTTVSGLCGIPVKRNNIIRPLIEVQRHDIESYCKEHNLPYVTDKTNLETIYTRNKVRLKLIPEIERDFNANFINTVTKNALIINDENNFIEKEAERIYEKCVSDGAISLETVKNYHIAPVRRVIMHMIADAVGDTADMTSTAIEDIISLCQTAQSGKSINLPGEMTAAIEYGRLIISKKADSVCEFEYKLEENRDIYIAELNVYARLERCNGMEKDDAMYFSVNEMSNIKLRNRRSGDIISPTGMKGRKKLKDLFIDDKIPRARRMTIPIITSDEAVVCVGRLRIDRNFAYGKNKINLKVILKQEENSIEKKTL